MVIDTEMKSVVFSSEEMEFHLDDEYAFELYQKIFITAIISTTLQFCSNELAYEFHQSEED